MTEVAKDWRVTPWGRVRDDGRCEWLCIMNHAQGQRWGMIEQVACVGNEHWGDREMGHARLLAAAPAMLEALKGVQGFMASSEEQVFSQSYLDDVNAAIALAEGRA